MTTKNNIPVGYKDSAVGIIPQEWEVKFFKDVCTFLNGRAYKQEELLSLGKYPVLRVGNFFTNTNWYYSDLELDKDKYAVEGDLLYAWSASFGPRFWNGEKVIYHYHIWKVVISSIIDKLFLYDYLEMDARKLYNQIQGGTMAHITKGDMEQRYIPVPPMEEQRKIAEILGVWDEAIEKQSRLIEKLELRKRALMQRLLTGRTRLPGFIDDVQYKKLKPFIVEKSERNTNQTYTKVLSVTNNRGFINQAEQFDREVASDNTANYKLVHRGQFAYNPSRVNVGSLDLLQTYDLGILSPLYIVFETRPTMDPKFLYYQLKSGWFVGHIPMYVQGSVRDSLSFDGLENMRFWIPSLPEQKAIAEVLTTADDEIATHCKKLDALRLQKRGLMQQLLTGKTRVKI